MKMEIFNVIDDPQEAEKRRNEKHLCYLLNPRVSVLNTSALLKDHFIFAVKHNGEIRKAISCGLYKRRQSALQMSNLSNLHQTARERKLIEEWLTQGDGKMFDGFIEDPLSIVLSEELSGNLMFAFKKALDIIVVRYNGRDRLAIACVYYDPTEQIEGQILSKEFIGVK